VEIGWFAFARRRQTIQEIVCVSTANRQNPAESAFVANVPLPASRRAKGQLTMRRAMELARTRDLMRRTEVAELERLEAPLAQTLKGGISDDGQFAFIRVMLRSSYPRSANKIEFALPIETLPQLLKLALSLIEIAESSPQVGANKMERGIFDAQAVKLYETEDGRQAMTFELALGSSISIRVDGRQAGTIASGLARRTRSACPPKQPKLH
jgi:hypothetical protein